MALLTGKTALITGIISNRSIAYGIAKIMHEQGAKLIVTYQNERFKDRIASLVEPWKDTLAIPCDVTSDQQIESLFEQIKEQHDALDVLVHSIAFAPKAQISGNYLDHVNREDFSLTHDISSYSLSALAKGARSLLKASEQAAILALTYHGSTQVIPRYNTMGIAKASLEASVRYLASDLGPENTRVNAISAGPIKTLAAAGIQNFSDMLKGSASIAPLRGNVTIEQVGNTATWLCSDLASAITGEIIYVDNGLHIMGATGLATTEDLP